MFKIGDKVRGIGEYGGRDINDRIGVVAAQSEYRKHVWLIDFGKGFEGHTGNNDELENETGFYVDESQLELIEETKGMFKIGDKVKAILSDQPAEDMVGVIADIPDDDVYLVDFGKGFSGHTGGGVLTTKTGWWVFSEDMTLFNEDVKIIQKGLVVIATRGENEGIARCNPADEFDLKTGIDLALKRLEEKKNYGKPFVPETGKAYYCVSWTTSKCAAISIFMPDFFEDALMAALKAAYHTREEAEEHADEIHAKMQKVLDYAKSL